MDLPKVRIGGEDITLPAIMNFTTLERAWPALQALDEAPDHVARVARSLAFLAQVLLETRPDLTLPELKKRLRVQRFDPDSGAPVEIDERPGVLTAVRELCIASGLISKNPPRGELEGDPPVPTTDPSPEAISATS